jgi:hypothetical protein
VRWSRAAAVLAIKPTMPTGALSVLIAPYSALIIGSLSPSVIGDRPSHPI